MFPSSSPGGGDSSWIEVTYQSNRVSLSKSPTAWPMPLSSMPVPEGAVASVKVPSPLLT